MGPKSFANPCGEPENVAARHSHSAGLEEKAMLPSGSVTRWIGRIKGGDVEAAQPLWDRYFHRLIELARPRLHAVRMRAAGPEDVALSALDSFFQKAVQGRFEQLRDRDDLWSLLAGITRNKAAKVVRHESAAKRGSGRVRGESALPSTPQAEEPDGFGQVLSKGPTPQEAAQFAEECQRLLDGLGDPTLRAVALWKIEGFSNKDIANKMGIVTRSVERKLNAIRKLWCREEGV